MALSQTTSEIISRAITNLNNIKNAITSMGVDATNMSSDDYADAIQDINKLNGTSLNITPSVSVQEFTPLSPYNGYTSVNVEAVTNTIDNNIVANNIKSGVSILGVNGSAICPTYSTVAPSSTSGYNEGDYWYVYTGHTVGSYTYYEITSQYVFSSNAWVQIV